MVGIDNFAATYRLADNTDKTEGCLAYGRYLHMMTEIAAEYQLPLERIVAAFVALSPNNDYVGNLRSLVSVLHGLRHNWPHDLIGVSTYRKCADRAISYLTGEQDFEKTVRGPKIRAFYFNILNPNDPAHVTIDGHMSALWQGRVMTMREAIVKPRVYSQIADDLKALARQLGYIPNQLQAILWFTRKRVLRIRFNAQLNLFVPNNDQWQTLKSVSEIKPFAPRRISNW